MVNGRKREKRGFWNLECSGCFIFLFSIEFLWGFDLKKGLWPVVGFCFGLICVVLLVLGELWVKDGRIAKGTSEVWLVLVTWLDDFVGWC